MDKNLCAIADGRQSVSYALVPIVCDLFDMYNYVIICQWKNLYSEQLSHVKVLSDVTS